MLDPNTEITMVKTDAQGQREIIVKKCATIEAYKVTGTTVAGFTAGEGAAWSRSLSLSPNSSSRSKYPR